MDGIQAPAIEPIRPAAPRPARNPEAKPRAEAESPTPRISVVMGGFLIAAALLFDGGQLLIEAAAGLTVILLPLGIAASWAIDAIAWLTFFLWFRALGLGTIKKGGAGASVLNQTPFVIIAFALGIEFIPFVNALPAWTAAIVVVILKERIVSLAQLAGPQIVSSALGRAIDEENKTK